MRKGRQMKILVITLTSFVAAGILLPNAGQVVFGAATTSAKVGDTVKVGITATQVDSGLSQLSISIPYLPSILEFSGVEGEGLEATTTGGTTYAEVDVKWTGSLPAGSSTHLGYVLFTVKRAGPTGYRGTGTNASALDEAGAQIASVETVPSEAVVQFIARPLRLLLDLLVE